MLSQIPSRETPTGRDQRVVPTAIGIAGNVVKSVIDLNGGSVLPGDTLQYDITVTNLGGAADATESALIDTLPAGTTYVAGSLVITSGPNAGPKTDAIGDDQGQFESTSGRLRFRLGVGATGTANGVIAIDSTTSVRFRVRVNAGVASGTSIDNLAHVRYDDPILKIENSTPSHPPGAFPDGTPTSVLVELPDLTISKSHVGNFPLGGSGSYTLTASNVGPGTTSGVITISDVVPAGLVPTAAAGAGWSCAIAGQTVTCTRSIPIAGGASGPPITLAVDVSPTAGSPLLNTATISGGSETATGNNSATDATTLESIPDLTITKVANGSFTTGTTASYALGVTNLSTGPTSGAITVTDTLPTGLTFVSGTGASWACAAAGQVVTCTNPGPITSGGSSTITLTVAIGAAASPSVTNRAWVTSPGDVNTGNNSAATTTPVAVPTIPDLAIVKTATSVFIAGASATYSIDISNVGTAATTGALTVTDTLPAGLTFTSAAGGGWTCAAAGQVLTCTNGGPFAVGASSSIALTVGVTAAAAPSVTNRAHVATAGDTNAANDVDSEVTPVTIPGTPDLAITKAHAGSFVAGQPGTWTIGVSNVGSAATTGALTVTDTLPTGVTFTSGGGSGWTCSAAGPVVTCTNPGPLTAGGSSSFPLTATIGAAAFPGITNRAHVATPGDTDPSNDAASDPTTVVSIPDLAITKVANGAFGVGSNASYTLSVSNVSAGPTTGAITVSDALPTGLTFVSGTGSGWTCSAAGQTVTCTNAGPLAGGATSAITLTVAVSLPAAPSVTNTATVATPGDVNGANDASTVSTPVPSPALDLSIAKAVGAPFVAGSNGTYTLTVSNTSLAPTTGATTITDVLPAGLTFVSGTGTGAACSAFGQAVTCTIAGVIAPSQVVTVSLVVAVAPTVSGTLSNTATVSTPGDGNAGNNSSTVTHPVASGTDLTLSKTASALAVGSTGDFTLTVSNVGSSPTTGAITVTDNLPAGVTFLSANGGGFTCTLAGTLVTCTRAAVLAPGQSAAITLGVAVGPAALPSVVNTATVTTPGDANPGNNTGSTGAIPVTASSPDLSLAKAMVTPFVAGATGTFRLTVTNVGNGATAGPISITDPLVAGLTFVSASGAGWNCSAAGSLVTCTNPGPIAPGASSTLDLVVAIAPGVTTISNSATVTVPGDANGGNNTGTVSATPIASPPDLSLTKVANAAFLVGQPASYAITVRNTGTGPTVGAITLTDAVPSSLTVTGAAGPGWTCTITGQLVTCTNPGPLAPGATAIVTITVVPTAAAVPAVTNTASVATPGDANPGNNDGSVTTPVGGIVDLALDKQGPDSLTVGGTATWTLTVRNLGTIATTGPIVVTDTLPAGLTFVAAAGPGFSCGAAGQLVTCTRTSPPLGPGASAAIDLTASISSDVTATVRNVACVKTPGDGNVANDCGSKSSTPAGSVDLVAVKDVAGTFTIGKPGTFTLTVRNLGSAPAQPPITVTDTLPGGLTFVSAVGNGWQCGASGQVVTCLRPTALPAGQVSTITLTVNVGALTGAQLTNCMAVRGANETGSLTNNRSCVTAPVDGRGQLEIEKRASRAEVQVGDIVDYTVVVRNTGTGPVNDAFITDVLPPGFLLEAASVRVDGVGGATVTGAPGPQFTVELGRIAAGGTTTVTYRVRVGAGARPGQYANVATAASHATGGTTTPARATVKVTGGAFDERGAIVGKVYVQCDCDRHAMQDAGEVGIPGVRVYLEDGTSAVTDVEGKYSFYNVASRLHVVKVDRASLPEGAVLVPLVNRNAGDGYTRFADVKAGELHRADFADASRSAEVLARVVERRRQGEVTNAGERAVPSTWSGASAPVVPGDTLRGEPRAAADLARGDGQQGASMYATRPIYPNPTGGTSSQAYAPLASGGPRPDDRTSQLPVTPLQARARQAGGTGALGRIELTSQPQGLPADGQTLVPFTITVYDAAGARVTTDVTATLEASVGRWLGASPVETSGDGWSVTLHGGRGAFFLVAPPTPVRGEVRVTTAQGEATVPVTFVPSNRDLLVAGLVNARVDFLKLVQGQLGVGATSDGFEEQLRDWSRTGDSARTRAGARAALLVKGTVLDHRLLTLSYDSERDRGRTFFRDIRPEEFFPVYGDAAMRDFDAQSRRRFYARLDKGTSYTMYGDFQTSRADDRRLLSAYDRSLTGAVQHVEGARGTATLFASQGRVRQAVDEVQGMGISGPYALSRATGLINSERVEILVRDRNQPSVILSRRPMTRFADYTIEPVTGRLLFRSPVPSADANLNPVSIRVTYETEDGTSDAFWVYGFDGSVRAGSRLELGGTYAKDEAPAAAFELAGLNATLKLGRGTLLLGEFARTDNQGARTANAQRLELRHQSRGFDLRLFTVRAEEGFYNSSTVFLTTGGRREVGGRFSKQLAEGTRFVGEALRSVITTSDQERTGALLAVEHDFSHALRGELGWRYGRSTVREIHPIGYVPLGDTLDANAIRARLQLTLPERTRSSLFGEVEQDVKDGDRHRIALGGEYLIAARARLYGRHEILSGYRDQYSPDNLADRTITVVGVDADYLRNTQVFSEYRGRDAFAGRDAQAAIGLRNSWPVAPGLTINTSFERVSPLLGKDRSTLPDRDAFAVASGIEWTKPSLWKTTARAEYRKAQTGNNALGSFGYARKLSRDWALLGRTLWDDFDGDLQPLQRQTRGFSQLGLAWRETDRNRWNGLARYEQRFERVSPLGSTPGTRSLAHILAAMLNYQPVQRFTLSGRYAARSTDNRANGLETNTTAQLLMGRGILDLTSRLDLGVISSALFTDGVSDRRYGLGGELGLVVMKNLRVAGGYNLFGFTDRDLNTFGTTRKGPYLELGFKFDEALFGLGGDKAPATRDGGRHE